jgi:nitrous oxide reductase accessory protein NosL
MRYIIVAWVFVFGTVWAQEAFKTKITLTEHNATDAVYLLPLNKYPKWLCEAEFADKSRQQFVSVKSMMQVYYHQDYFLARKLIPAKIEKLYVQDYLTGEKVDARKAFYVFGSRIVGPHGDDLIPFSSEENAKLFMLKHGGTKILPFGKLSKGLIRYLDM